MANTFSFEDALKPAPQAAPQQGPTTFSFEDAFKPAVTSGPNPLDPQQPAPVQAAQPAPTPTPAPVAKEEPGLLNDISKGFQRIPASLAEQYEGIFTRKTAQMAKGNQVQTALYNMIDAGQIKSDSDLDKAYLKLLYGKDQLSPKEILAHGNLKQSLAAADAYEYMNSSPEHRAAMRKGVETAASQSLTRFEESRARSKEREAELEKLAPRVKQFTDIGSPYEAASWAAGRLPEFVGTNLPQIAAGYFTGPGGLALTSVIPELSGGTKERVKYMEGIVKDEPDPAKRSQALIDYINKTQDVTLQAAVLNGLTDMIIGPEAEAVKLGVQSAFRQEVRKEILKKLPKVVGGEALGEGATGGIQEITNMVAERSLGEMQGGVFTAENAKRIINSMADEALGGAGVSTGMQLTKAALAKKNLADTDTPEGRALRGLDDLANRESAGTTEEVTVPSTEGEIVPGAGVTQVEAKGILENLTTQLGRDPTDQEFEDAYDDYISQRTGTGAGTSVAGTTDTSGAQSDTGTGVPPSSEGTGLGVPDTSTEGTGAPEGMQSGALEEGNIDPRAATVEPATPVVDKKEIEQTARGGWFELPDAERLELQGDLQFLRDSGKTITVNNIPEETRAKLSSAALINIKSALDQDVDATIAALTPSSKKETAPVTEQVAPDAIPEEVTALNDTIKKGIDDKLEGLLVGDEVRFGNTPGVVVGLEGDYAKFHSAGSSNPKAYTRIPKNQLTFVSRPNTNFTSASSKEPTKFGEEAAILDVDKARITKTLGANMYASNIADVAVKELLQNSFDSIKAAVHFGEIEEGKIDIKFDSNERTITIKDNGQGMSSEIVKKAFFTIGGSNKAGVPMELQSGGFGMAKLGFIMGSESIQLDTVKDGVRTKVDATSDEIGNDNFKLMKSPAPANEHGTTLTVKIPKTYTDSRTGEEKSIYFPRGTYGVNALNRPLVGPVEVNVDFDGSEETLPMGAKFDFEETPKLTTVKFPWGSADVYFGVERKASKYSINHRVLSSGVYQFDYDKFTLGQNEKIPYDIVVDIKSAVPATDREYPFEKSRERFNAVIEEDIASLAQYLAKVARGHEAEGLQETFKDIVTMPRTEVGEETAEASKKLKKVFDKRGDTEKGTYELPPMPKEIIISGGTVTDTKGTVLVDKEKTDDRKRKSEFEADKAAPEMAQFLVDMKQDPRQPIFHNNTNTDLLEVGRKYGNPEQFFAELGTLVVEMKEELAKSGIYTYDQLAPENLFFAGVSIDKGYGGVFIRVPFKGILLNPFYDWGAKTLFGIRQNFLNTMIHEIAHQTTGEHDRGHENAMLKIEQHLADNGTLDYFRDALLDILVKHESTFTAMREAYGRSTTKNVAKSLEDYGKSSTSTEVGGDEGSRTDTSGELSERGGQVRGSDVRTDSGETGKSEVGRGSPKFSISAEEKLVEQGMAAGNLHPTVVEAILNNDINSALQIASQRMSGFSSELAAKLASLNLPTNIRVGDQRNMTRQSIDANSAPAQIQLFNFIRVAMPDVYNKYFQGYDKTENIEKVYEGLKHIQNNPKLKSVLPQYNTVFESYEKNIDGLSALGAYYPRFDEINLNNAGLTYRTFLHEVTHAATEILLRTPASERTAEQNEAIAELEKLFEAAKASSNLPYYGFTDLSEFIAEIFTSPKFQNELKKVPYPAARTNIFNRFVKVIMDMFGMDNITGRAMTEAQKLFNVERPTAPMSAGPRFAGAKGPRKKGPISSSWRTVEDTMKSVKDWEVIKKDLIPAMWDATNGVFRNIMLGTMNLRQIADVTKTKFPQIDAAIRTIEKMLAYRGKIMNDGGEIVQRWTKAQAKNLKGSQLLGRVMLEATIRGLEVDPQSKEYNVLKVNKELADAWNALGSDFQQIYRDVRDFYVRAVQETVRLMKERANNVTDPVERQELIDKIDAQFGPDKLKGPYFPLRRFGEFWFQVGEGNFKEFYMYEGRVARTIAMRVRKRELSKGNAQQRALAETISKGNGMSALYGQNVGTTKILQDVQDIVDSIGNSVVDNATGLPRDKTQDELKGEIRDSLNQLIYILLPQQSMRKMFINRKAIQGASGDMLRVFATHAVHSAYQRSRFKYAQDFMDNLSNAQNWIASFAKGDKAEVYRDYVNEVEKRSKTILGTEDTSLAARAAGKVSEAVFYFMLSAPFTAMLNLVGFAQIAMPYIGGRFGYAKTNARILENMGKYLQTAPKRTFSPLVNGAVMDMSFPSIVEGGNLTGILKDAAQQLLDEEQINISLTNDILNVGSGPTAAYTGTYNAVKRGMAALFHQSERLNREITLLSVVELAYEKFMSEPIKDAKGIIQRDAQGQPMRYTDNATTSDGTTQYSKEALELAINEAKDIAGLSLGDFTRQMKPRYFTPPLLSVLTKFKQYAVLASYAVIRNAQLGLLKPFSKAELDELRGVLEEHYKTAVDKDQIIEQQMAEAQTRQKEIAKEARRRLAGILGMTYLFGGYVALPFFSAVTPILVGMLAGDEDDEDEFFNWENWFKNYMETEFGGYVGAMLQKFGVDQAKARKIGSKVSETLVYGPASTVTGGALSDRVSLDLKNLWYRDGRYSPDTRESIVESMIANAGPVVGLTVNAADAWDMMQEGKVGRAFERMAPALFAKPVTAGRLATEGAKTKGGDVLVDELTTTEIALQAIGLQPLRVAKAQKASIETVEKVQKIQDQYSSIMNRLWMERNNPQEFNDALEKLNAFAIKHPGYKINGNTIKESFKKRTEDAALADVFGARIPKPLQSDPTVTNMPNYGKD